jgi:phospholipid/cholesterol/gamma-HCH transport system permease protein
MKLGRFLFGPSPGLPNRMELISPTDFAKQKVLSVQEYTLLAAQSIGNVFRKPVYFPDMVQQADFIGVGSLPIVLLTGFFTGAVLAVQSANTLQRFGSITLIGQLVSLSMVRELGPVLTGLMVAGRNASGMASELGSMIVTEQIDAMRALGTDPMKKLVTPRIVASVFMLFFLTVLSDFVGLAGGLFVSKVLLSLDARQYWSNAWQALVFEDVFMGLVKPIMFGFIIATVGCYYGMTARGGTQGVGKATTQAVVAASVLIVVTDLFVTQFLMSILPYK